MKRLRRVMKPRADGSYLIPKEMLEKWSDIAGGGREEVLNMWNASGGQKDGRCGYCIPTYHVDHIQKIGTYI